MEERSIDDALKAIAEQSRQAELENDHRRLMEIDGAFARYRYDADKRISALERETRDLRFWLIILGAAVVTLVVEHRFGKGVAAVVVAGCVALFAIFSLLRAVRSKPSNGIGS